MVDGDEEDASLDAAVAKALELSGVDHEGRTKVERLGADVPRDDPDAEPDKIYSFEKHDQLTNPRHLDTVEGGGSV